jgi:hypothetical protein
MSDSEDRVERGSRLLENIVYHGAADLWQLGRGHAKDVVSVEQNLAADIACRTGQQARNRECRHTLPRPTLAHKAESLTGINRERDAIQRTDSVWWISEFEFEVVYLEQGHKSPRRENSIPVDNLVKEAAHSVAIVTLH